MTKADSRRVCSYAGDGTPVLLAAVVMLGITACNAFVVRNELYLHALVTFESQLFVKMNNGLNPICGGG